MIAGSRGVTLLTPAARTALAAILLLIAVTWGDVPDRALAAPARVAVAGSIPLPGSSITAIALYQAGNRLFVMDDATGRLLTFNTVTKGLVSSTFVGSGTFQVKASEATGEVYAASTEDARTSGINPGTGLISILDATSGALLRSIDPAKSRTQFDITPRYPLMVIDDAGDRVYVGYEHFSAFGDSGCLLVINTRDDTFVCSTEVYSNIISTAAVNQITGEAFFTFLALNTVYVLKLTGDTITQVPIDLTSTGGSKPIDIAANDLDNTLYVTMILAPGQGEIAILVYDLLTRAFKYVGKDDLEPLAFNRLTNRLFTAVQVGQRGAIIDGPTSELTYYEAGDGSGSNGIAVRNLTDHAFSVGSAAINVIDGTTKSVLMRIPTPRSSEFCCGGHIVVEQRSGQVFAAPSQRFGSIMVIQDDTVAVPTRRLDVLKSGAGRGNVVGAGIQCGASCSADVPPWDIVGLRAVPDDGSYFDHWEGACSGRDVCRLSMLQSQTVTAVFTSERPRGAGERVALTSTRSAEGRLQVQVSPGCGQVRQIRFAPATGTRLVIGGIKSELGTGYVYRPVEPGPVAFTVERVIAFPGPPGPKPPFAAKLTVLDDCGRWSTFVGGGGSV